MSAEHQPAQSKKKWGLKTPRPWMPWPLVLLPFIIALYIWGGIFKVASRVYKNQERARKERNE